MKLVNFLKMEKTLVKGFFFLIMNIRGSKNSNGAKINADFYGKKIPKESSHCTFVSVIVIDCVCKINKDSYP